jgi:fatty acid-binding protein DegV
MMVEETFNVVEFIHSNVGATIGANAGEGAVAIALTSVLPELAY